MGADTDDATVIPSPVAQRLAEICSQLPGGGEARPGQSEMADSVAEAIVESQHLIARAGTGTGKSLAYLVPAALSGKTTVIATATKALQDQLADKDLPFLSEHLPVTYAVLKGRNNYLCRQRANELEGDRQMAMDGIDATNINDELDDLLEWSKTTRSGDRASLDVEPSNAAWGALSVSSGECPGAARCPSGGDCFAEKARMDAEDADIIVVNTHLYGIHLAADQGILPDHQVAIIDEAHQLEDVISATAGLEITSGRFGDLARKVGAIVADDDIVTALYNAGDALAAALDPLDNQRVDPTPDDHLGRAIYQGRDAVDRALSALRNIDADEDASDGSLASDVAARKLRAQQGATNLIAALDGVWTATDADVTWVGGPPHNKMLRVAPIDVGETLRETLWDLPTVVLTSATVPEVLPEQLGLEPGSFEFIDVASPFDYESNAVLYCAADLPDPRADGYEEELHREIEALMVAAGGRTLALFTSWRAMKAAVETLRPRMPWEILAQGERPKPALLEAFRDDPEASLFATMSFWQGVDVRGETLSLVIVDRLPFPRPDDPLLEARRDRVGRRDAFRKVDLPRAATMLAQGTGRLIRSTTDQGVVAVLDSRLAKSRSYRWDLLAALPPYPRSKDRAEVEAFLRRLRDGDGN